jgi:3-hydroxybutyryl-CoA dehydrogenase
MNEKQKLYIVGDEQLVHEWKSFCETKGFFIQTNGNQTDNIFLCIELTLFDEQKKKANLEFLSAQFPNTPILTSSITITAIQQSIWLNGTSQLLGISAFPTFLQRELIEVASPPNITKETWETIQSFFLQIEKQFSVVQDRVGMVLPRIICMLVNEAFFALQEEIATPEAIDTAMKLGTNYPFGPIEWGEKIGYENVVAVLSTLHKELGDDRYRVAPLLRQVSLEKKSVVSSQ